MSHRFPFVDLFFNVSLYRFLRVVDRFNSLLVSAFITPGGTVMLLLHNGRAPEESVRSFFSEASELFAKHIMNPFAILGTKNSYKVCLRIMKLKAYCRMAKFHKISICILKYFLFPIPKYVSVSPPVIILRERTSHFSRL